jgi:5-methylcytosine-specific restriction endonuclease McrA
VAVVWGRLSDLDAAAPKLTVELVPKTCWWSNLHTLANKATWDRIRRIVWRQAEYRCQICGGVGLRHPVECHEVWQYDETTRAQILVRMIALCPACHEVKHMGFAGKRGRNKSARDHLAKVNGWTNDQVLAHVAEAFAIWRRRSKVSWKLDLSGYIRTSGARGNWPSSSSVQARIGLAGGRFGIPTSVNHFLSAFLALFFASRSNSSWSCGTLAQHGRFHSLLAKVHVHSISGCSSVQIVQLKGQQTWRQPVKAAAMIRWPRPVLKW